MNKTPITDAALEWVRPVEQSDTGPPNEQYVDAEFARELERELAAVTEERNAAERQLLHLLADIRAAAGDPEGRLMQSDLVDYIAGLRRDEERLDWLLDRDPSAEVILDYAFDPAWDRKIILDNRAAIDAEMEEEKASDE